MGSHRKAAALAMQISDSNSSAAKGAGGKTVQVAAGEAAPQRRSRAEADAADFRTRAKEADEGRVRGGASSGQERRSMGGTPLAEGEAVVQRKADFEAPRQGAHERVFGGRKKSMISGAQLRGADLDDETREVGVAEASATSAAARAAAARAHREKLEQFDREQADWFSLKRACSVPSNYGGVRLRSPPTADDIDRMISSFTKPDPEPLHQHFLYELLLGVYRMWECPPPGYLGQSAKSVMDLPEPPDGSKLIIVGDTHGQLADVLWIFAEYAIAVAPKPLRQFRLPRARPPFQPSVASSPSSLQSCPVHLPVPSLCALPLHSVLLSLPLLDTASRSLGTLLDRSGTGCPRGKTFTCSMATWPTAARTPLRYLHCYSRSCCTSLDRCSSRAAIMRIWRSTSARSIVRYAQSVGSQPSWAPPL